jgi:renalase
VPGPDAAELPVIVIGGGISGVACARRLHDAGRRVRLLDRGRRLGGRMASRTEHVNGRAHAVDIGAPYFTVRDPRFEAVVAGLESAGLARRWTDAFALAGPNGRTGDTTGPQRWSSTRGLRALVEALADGSGLERARLGGGPEVEQPNLAGLDVHLEVEVTRVEYDAATGVPLVDGEPAAAVVLAMPDPQAARLVPADLAERLGVRGRDWSPVFAAWAAWPHRWWLAFDGIFVAESAVLSWVADSGRSRGDDAAVLVAHTTPEFTERHLGGSAERRPGGSFDSASILEAVLAELRHVVGGPVPPPEWGRVHRWSLASARETHPDPFLLLADGRIGVCGDAWGPLSRIEQAWSSGDGLAGELIRRLTVSS